MKAGLIIFFAKRALQDIVSNRFLHSITIITIALSILIVSAFGLFFVNADDMMNAWKKGIRIMAYLKGGVPTKETLELKNKLLAIGGVQEAKFIPRDEALDQLKNQMKRQSSIFENLRENPLPDVFEVRILSTNQSWERVEMLATQIEALPEIEGVEYGQHWLGRVTGIFNLFRFAGFAMCGVFFFASVFIVANTIRLLFYSRRDELEIMRLVGATDNFIKAPFYMEGIIQGALGGILGIVVLYLSYVVITSNVEHGFASSSLNVRFLPFVYSVGIIMFSMFAGWLGCYLSLKQFLNR